jgi:hypothetical protein
VCCTYSYCYGGNMNHDVFPTDAVGMYIISYHAVCCIYSYCCCGNHAVTCSITQILLRNVNKFHFVPLLTLLDLSVPQKQGIWMSTKEVSAIERASREACRTGHCAQPSVYRLATAVDPASTACSCRESFAVSSSATSRRSPPEYADLQPTNSRPRGAATIVKPGA